VFEQRAVGHINSFDQWGVELGKSVEWGILADIRAERSEDANRDPATRVSLSD
jgi:Glucose-6-phosphate isomerase